MSDFKFRAFVLVMALVVLAVFRLLGGEHTNMKAAMLIVCILGFAVSAMRDKLKKGDDS